MINCMCNFDSRVTVGLNCVLVKFVYSKKATTFFEISTSLLSTVHPDNRKVEISKNFVAFSEYMNFELKNYYTFNFFPRLSLP